MGLNDVNCLVRMRFQLLRHESSHFWWVRPAHQEAFQLIRVVEKEWSNDLSVNSIAAMCFDTAAPQPGVGRIRAQTRTSGKMDPAKRAAKKAAWNLGP